MNLYGGFDIDEYRFFNWSTGVDFLIGLFDDKLIWMRVVYLDVWFVIGRDLRENWGDVNGIFFGDGVVMFINLFELWRVWFQKIASFCYDLSCDLNMIEFDLDKNLN